jgi:hypothetical protein
MQIQAKHKRFNVNFSWPTCKIATFGIVFLMHQLSSLTRSKNVCNLNFAMQMMRYDLHAFRNSSFNRVYKHMKTSLLMGLLIIKE